MLAALASAAALIAGDPTPLAEPIFTDAVSNVELAQMRGGFSLPNGMMLDLSVDVQAAVDGKLLYAVPLLHLRTNTDNPNLTASEVSNVRGTGVSLNGNDGGASVQLALPSIGILQTVGSATGIVIANVSDDRSIDVKTTINAQLGGLAAARYMPLLAALRVIGNRPLTTR